MPRQIKELMRRELERKFQDIGRTGCVVVSCGSVAGPSTVQMRRSVREQGGEITVVRNALFSLALSSLRLGEIGEMLDGPSAIVRAENAVAAAKIARDAAKEHSGVVVLGGYAEGRLLDAAGVARLAEIPGRDDLLSMLAGAFLAPARQLLSCLLAKPRALVSCLDQLKDEKQAEPDEAQ